MSRRARARARHRRRNVNLSLLAIALILAVVVPVLTVGANSSELMVSQSPDRSPQFALQGAELAGNVYIFVPDAAEITRVRFSVDGKGPVQAEKKAPWDLAGTAKDGTALAFDTTQLRDGVHSVTAVVRGTEGWDTTLTATFRVANQAAQEPAPSEPEASPSPSEPEPEESPSPTESEPTSSPIPDEDLLVSRAPDRSDPLALSGADLNGDAYIFVPTAPDISQVDFYLDGAGPVQTEKITPWDLAGTADDDTALPYDTTQLADGGHTVTAYVHRTDGTSTETAATFTVENASGTEPEPEPSPTEPEPSPSESETTPTNDGPAGLVDHGEDLTVDNTGLRGAGYVHDAGSDTFSHPEHGPLEETGSITTSKDGQVIEGVDVAGKIQVRHDNVTIRNCRVRYSGTEYAIDARRYEPAGTVIEDCDITHVGDTPYEAFGVYLADGVLHRSNVSRFQVGVFVNGSNTRVEYTLVSDAQKVSGTHGTGMSANNGGTNIVFFRNRINGNSSAALALYAQNPFYDVTVEDNLLDGGNGASYCLNAGDNKNGVGVNEGIRVLGNLFGRTTYPECGEYGPYFSWDGSRPGAVWCDNQWRDTREPIGTPTGCQE